MNTVMISFDVSSTCTGYAKYINGELNTHGTFDFSKRKLDLDVRLKAMKNIIINYLKLEKPQIIVVEESASKNNIKVQRMLSEIIGVIEGYCILNNADFVKYIPVQWRNLVKEQNEIVPKNTKPVKKWSINKVNFLFKGVDVIDNNESDAILIGLARIKECDALMKKCS